MMGQALDTHTLINKRPLDSLQPYQAQLPFSHDTKVAICLFRVRGVAMQEFGLTEGDCVAVQTVSSRRRTIAKTLVVAKINSDDIGTGRYFEPDKIVLTTHKDIMLEGEFLGLVRLPSDSCASRLLH